MRNASFAAQPQPVVRVHGLRKNDIDDRQTVRGSMTRWNTDHVVRSEYDWVLEACKYYLPDLCAAVEGSAIAV